MFEYNNKHSSIESNTSFRCVSISPRSTPQHGEVG